jgi:hypothetical protein
MAAIFEAPVGHEGVNPTAFEWEWEFEDGSHLGASPEWEEAATGEWEWEQQPAAGGWASEFEEPASGEWEWEQPFAGEWEGEWEQIGSGEWEADAFSFGGLLKGIGKVAKGALPIVAKSLASMVPGVGAIAGPLAGQLAQSLVGEGEAMAAEAEAEAFGGSSGEAEIGNSDTAHEAALSELLAAEAAMSPSETEAASTISAALPLTITIMRAGPHVRPVMPALTQANARVVRALHRGGPRGRQLLRATPAIHRLAVGTIKSAARSGRPITAPLAVGSMATAAHRVLGNPRRVEAVVRRNAALRQQTGPPHPQRALVYRPRRTGSYGSHPYAGNRW